MPNEQPTWEQRALENVALAVVQEQRAARRWKIIFRSIRLILLGLLAAYLFGWLPSKTEKTEKKLGVDSYTALVNMVGEIGPDDGEGFVVTADQVITSLQEAFKDPHAKGVILHVNSPGGTPVAAARIYDAIRDLRKQYPNKPIYTVVDDMCASACYYAAAATDQIFVNRASMVGSIGVLINGFGFTKGMEKLGVERRLITAGEHKGFLDPFSPLDPKQLAFTKALLQELHQQFIDAVKVGRGSRLKETPDMFSGLIWSGVRATGMGLVDGQGTVEYVAKAVIHAEEVVDFTHKRTWIDILTDQFSVYTHAGLNSLFALRLR